MKYQGQRETAYCPDELYYCRECDTTFTQGDQCRCPWHRQLFWKISEPLVVNLMWGVIWAPAVICLLIALRVVPGVPGR